MPSPGVGNIARAEAALFALMFGKNLAEPASPFEQGQEAKKAPSSSSRSRHAPDRDGGIVHLGRKCLWLHGRDPSVSAPGPPTLPAPMCTACHTAHATQQRHCEDVSSGALEQRQRRRLPFKDPGLAPSVHCCRCSHRCEAGRCHVCILQKVELFLRCCWLLAAAAQDPHPLDGAEELGAHCQGAALAAFVKQNFSVIQHDFMKRGYLCHAGLCMPYSHELIVPENAHLFLVSSFFQITWREWEF